MIVEGEKDVLTWEDLREVSKNVKVFRLEDDDPYHHFDKVERKSLRTKEIAPFLSTRLLPAINVRASDMTCNIKSQPVSIVFSSRTLNFKPDTG